MLIKKGFLKIMQHTVSVALYCFSFRKDMQCETLVCEELEGKIISLVVQRFIGFLFWLSVCADIEKQMNL